MNITVWTIAGAILVAVLVLWALRVLFHLIVRAEVSMKDTP